MSDNEGLWADTDLIRVCLGCKHARADQENGFHCGLRRMPGKMIGSIVCVHDPLLVNRFEWTQQPAVFVQ